MRSTNPQRPLRGAVPPRRAGAEEPLVRQERAAELIAFDEALQELAKLSSRQGRVVELRYFGGLSVEETATVLEVSPETVMRDWRLAKVWLFRELGREAGSEA